MPSHITSGRYRSPSMVRARNVLLGRAVAARTFGGLGSFLAVIFLGSGIYLLQESFTDPLQAQAVGLIAGAFIIALATILIYFISTPRKRFETDEIRRSHPPARSLPVSTPPLVKPKQSAKSLATTIAPCLTDRDSLNYARGIVAK
jgi:hypothetical protein